MRGVDGRLHSQPMNFSKIIPFRLAEQAEEVQTAVFPGAYQSHLAQMAHVMGNGRFADTAHVGTRRRSSRLPSGRR